MSCVGRNLAGERGREIRPGWKGAGSQVERGHAPTAYEIRWSRSGIPHAHHPFERELFAPRPSKTVDRPPDRGASKDVRDHRRSGNEAAAPDQGWSGQEVRTRPTSPVPRTDKAACVTCSVKLAG